MCDPITLDQFRHARPVWKIGRSVVADERCSAQKRRAEHKRAGDPSDVGWPAENGSGIDIEVDGSIVRDLDWESAMNMNRAFRLTGSAGRKDHHERIVRRHARRGRRLCCRPAKVFPAMEGSVEVWRTRILGLAFDHNDAEARKLGTDGLDRTANIDKASAALESAGCDQASGRARTKSCNDCVCAKSAEQRNRDCSDIADCQQRNCCFNAILHQQPDTITPSYSEGQKPGGYATHLIS